MITVYSTSPTKPHPSIAFYAADSDDVLRLIAKAKINVLNRNKSYFVAGV